jgi:hypothetical protein
MVMEPPRRELKHLMKLGIGKGELSPDLDLDLALAMLLGPMIYWHVFLKRTAEEPRALAEGILEGFWRAFGRNSALSEKSPRVPVKSGRI